MQKLRAILLLFCLIALPAVALCQAHDSIPAEDSTSAWQTPFNPKANYQTIGLRARALPWIMGNAGGLNVLLGAEIGFLKHHSIEIDGYFYGDEDHHDNYYGPNDPKNKDSDDYGGSNRALFFAYNYHYSLQNLREQMGLEAYTGLCGRIGQFGKTWDRGICKDSVLRSDEHYYSAGPQAGIILTFNEERHFAINLNAAVLYTMKDLSQQSTHSMALSDNSYHFNTCDLRIGINLYWWFRYNKR